MTDDFLKKVGATLETAMKLKAVMLKRKLTVAKAKCPGCDGHVHGRIAGPRNHMRMWCDGTCGAQMME